MSLTDIRKTGGYVAKVFSNQLNVRVWHLKNLHIHKSDTFYETNDIEMRCLTLPRESVFLGGGVPDISLGTFQHLKAQQKSKSQQRSLRMSGSE